MKNILSIIKDSNYGFFDDNELPDGVAEQFIEWTKKEKLNFWK